MVIKPYFKLSANGKDITEAISRDLISLNLQDYDGDNSDQLSFKIAGIFKHPILGDTLSLELGTEKNHRNYGKFVVDSSRIDYKAQNTSFSATAIDFVGKLKTRQCKLWEHISLANLAAIIAKNHGMESVYRGEEINILSYSQHDSSDIDFLHELAKDYGLIFSIKNNTIALLPKGTNYKFSCDIALSDCQSLSIQRSGRAKYGSVEVTWHDTNTASQLSATAGVGEPVFHMQDKAPCNMAEGSRLAQAKLDELSRKTMSGSLSIAGDRIILAGGKLTLTGAGSNDGDYHIESVSHSMNPSSYTMSVQFTTIKKEQ